MLDVSDDADDLAPGMLLPLGLGRALFEALANGAVEAVAAFLRVINVLENIRSAIELLEDMPSSTDSNASRATLRLDSEIQDAIRVLRRGRLHFDTVPFLEAARVNAALAAEPFLGRFFASIAVSKLESARRRMVE